MIDLMKKPKRPHRLRDLEITAIAAADRGSNPGAKVVLMKVETPSELLAESAPMDSWYRLLDAFQTSVNQAIEADLSQDKRTEMLRQSLSEFSDLAGKLLPAMAATSAPSRAEAMAAIKAFAMKEHPKLSEAAAIAKVASEEPQVAELYRRAAPYSPLV